MLTNLAMVGALRRDPDQLVMYADAAVDAAKQTGSAGYVGRKLSSLKPQLKPFLEDSHIRPLIGKPAYVADWAELPEWQRATDADIFERIERDA